MSFGFSVGDFVAVGQLAWQVYKSCKDAPKSFKNVSQEVLSLHAVLKEAEETLSGYPLSQSKEASLATITSGCQDVLKDLQTLVLRYESLGSKTKRTWDRLRWHSDDIAELRARLTSNTVLLTAYISTSQCVVGRQLNKFMQEFKDGKHEPSVMTTQTIESLSTDEKEKWRNIRKELENIGISVSAFDANKFFILEWFKVARSTGAFEEQTLEDDSNSISYESDPHQSLGDPDSTTSEYVTQQVPSLRSKDAESLDSNQPGTQITTTKILQNSVPSAPQISFKDVAKATPRILLTVPTQKIRPPRVAATAVQGRSQPTMGGSPSTPNGLSREGGEILNRVVVSKPEVDIERKREREWMDEATTGLNVVSSEGVDDAGRGGSRSRHDNTATSSKREKNTKFGEYFLGNTLAEGEFGKIKIGWKEEGGMQVAIKLIRRVSVSTSPTRLAKIYRGVAILREVSHPNIIRLHEMVETEKHIGIIIEYASGGELFDYILDHRYLKDNTAGKLFAQLISGVGYLHKKGIVHRDLKLENLLLDRNCNIIIIDFGFANVFNPNDELGEEIEYGLASREYVKRMELDKVLPNGFRRGDLMQTSCGTPRFAAPELVVSDSLYTGRKADVWSCGVILYAMLAGYLPFDDDPKNPDGDNINLLYKYIVFAPLTFPTYVTPHARDLLRRILVPNPRTRADLFEVSRHNWLSQYADIVGFITSSTTATGDIANTIISMDNHAEVPLLARSASVREPTKAHVTDANLLGPLTIQEYKTDKDVLYQTEKTSQI